MGKRDFVSGLGPALRAARTAKELTPAQVEAATGVAASSLSRYETDAKTPTLAVLYRLAMAYGVEVGDLVPLVAQVSLPTQDDEEPPPAEEPPPRVVSKRK